MAVDQQREADARELLQILKAEEIIRLCQSSPNYLLDYVDCVDRTTGETFVFDLLTAKERQNIGRPSRSPGGWHWQRAVLDTWQTKEIVAVLKARQLGITWLASGEIVWDLLAKPGIRALVISVSEDDAAKIIDRIWTMYQSLPKALQMGTKVVKPAQGYRPHTLIELEHPNGSISSVLGLSSKPSAGHGETAGKVLLDEYGRHPYASDSWTALFPTIGGGGQVRIVSTANGTSNQLTGEGNFFHWIWMNAEDIGVHTQFLKWNLPEHRDQAWYDRFALPLPTKARAESYPNSPEEAFVLTGDVFFDVEALAYYADHLPKVLRRVRFMERDTGKAALHESPDAPIRLYREPVAGNTYAIGADVATGRGKDYSCAYVIDLTNMELVAEYHAKQAADLYAEQLHYLGRYYNTAVIAIEMGGGYGEPVIQTLKGNQQGRPAYPKLYRYRHTARPEHIQASTYGYPVNTRTRPQIINQLEAAIRERSLPWLTDRLLMEARTFVHAKTTPSPRAQEGCNDDSVMAAAITAELYREYGTHPKRKKRSAKKPYQPQYPWQQAS